jgi:hypothetical protein
VTRRRRPSFAEYAAALADELGVQLEPWQARVLDDVAAGRPTLPSARLGLVCHGARRAHRRWRASALLAAGAIALNRDVETEVLAIAGDVTGEAAGLLNRYAAACDVDVGLATEAIRAIVR